MIRNLTFKIDEEFEDIEILAIIKKRVIGHIRFAFFAFNEFKKDIIKKNKKEFSELFSGNDICFIEELFVKKKYRSKGLGKELMHLCFIYSEIKNITEFLLFSSPISDKGLNKKELISFYNGLGFFDMKNFSSFYLMGKT